MTLQELRKTCASLVGRSLILFYVILGTKWQNSRTILVQKFHSILFYFIFIANKRTALRVWLGLSAYVGRLTVWRYLQTLHFARVLYSH